MCFKFKECQGLKLDYENLDKVLGSEDRTVNEYFGIYKIKFISNWWKWCR